MVAGLSLGELFSSAQGWRADAACIGLTGRTDDWWSPDDALTRAERGLQFHLARRVCAECPVNLACATDAVTRLEVIEEDSMRGGLTPDELLAVAKMLGLPYRRRAQCGTRSKYVAGCRCPDCREAHRTYEHERRLHASKGGSRRPQGASRPRSPYSVVSRRLSATTGRTARSISTATGLKTRDVRAQLDRMVQAGRARQIGVSDQGAPLYARVLA